MLTPRHLRARETCGGATHGARFGRRAAQGNRGGCAGRPPPDVLRRPPAAAACRGDAHLKRGRTEECEVNSDNTTAVEQKDFFTSSNTKIYCSTVYKKRKEKPFASPLGSPALMVCDASSTSFLRLGSREMDVAGGRGPAEGRGGSGLAGARMSPLKGSGRGLLNLNRDGGRNETRRIDHTCARAACAHI